MHRQQIQLRASTKQQNMIDHIDCFVKFDEIPNETSVDVKRKTCTMAPETTRQMALGQWVGRSGNLGGPIQKTRLHRNEMLNKSFLVVNREELEEYVAELIEKNKTVKINTVTDAKNGIIYTRQGNKDQLTLSNPKTSSLNKTFFFKVSLLLI